MARHRSDLALWYAAQGLAPYLLSAGNRPQRLARIRQTEIRIQRQISRQYAGVRKSNPVPLTALTSRRDQIIINRQVAVCGNLKAVTGHIRPPGQIKIAVVGKIANCQPVRLCAHAEATCGFITYPPSKFNVQTSGKAHMPIWQLQRKADLIWPVCGDLP